MNLPPLGMNFSWAFPAMCSPAICLLTQFFWPKDFLNQYSLFA